MSNFLIPLPLLGQALEIQVAVMLCWALLSFCLLYVVVLARPAGIIGPSRFSADEPPILLVGLGFAAILGGGLAAGMVHLLPVPNNMATSVVALLTYAAGSAVILLGTCFLRENGLNRLGLTMGRLPRGIAVGLFGIFLFFPLVVVTGYIVTLVMAALNLPAPNAHQVLQALSESPRWWVSLTLAVVAVVGAPIFEELLFRGLLQTLLVRLFTRNTALATVPLETNAPTEAPSAGAEPGDAPPVQGPATPSLTRQAIVGRWMAILLTSLIFAWAHATPAFIAPLMVLSIGIGYVYEATGNLWSSITLHAAFNGIQVALVASVGLSSAGQ